MDHEILSVMYTRASARRALSFTEGVANQCYAKCVVEVHAPVLKGAELNCINTCTKRYNEVRKVIASKINLVG